MKIKNSFVSGIELFISHHKADEENAGIESCDLSLSDMSNGKIILIKAAGGLVINENKEILFMFRRGKWDLPKGKLDPGESLESCAQREVKEETGISYVELVRFLIITEHEYEEKGKIILKETHWWLMKTNSHQQLKPQAEEDITGVKWISPADFKIVQQNTYPSILEILRAGGYEII